MACSATAGKLARELAPATAVALSRVAAGPTPAGRSTCPPPPGLRNASTLLGLDSCGPEGVRQGLAWAVCGPEQGGRTEQQRQISACAAVRLVTQGPAAASSKGTTSQHWTLGVHERSHLLLGVAARPGWAALQAGQGSLPQPPQRGPSLPAPLGGRPALLDRYAL